jgi:hypothetical protein
MDFFQKKIFNRKTKKADSLSSLPFFSRIPIKDPFAARKYPISQ